MDSTLLTRPPRHSHADVKTFARLRADIARNKNIRRGLAVYKLQASPEDIVRFLPFFLEQLAYRKLIWPRPIPMSLSELGGSGLPLIASFEQELAWNFTSLAVYADLISHFNERRQDFEGAFLCGRYEEAELELTSIEAKFGQSVWLIEAKINLAQARGGYKAQVDLSKKIVQNKKVHPLIRYMINFIGYRAEQNMSAKEFSQILDEYVPLEDGFAFLLHTFFGNLPDLDGGTAAAMLSYCDIFPVIDRYILCVMTVQALFSGSLGHSFNVAPVLFSVEYLASRVSDPSLKRLQALLAEAPIAFCNTSKVITSIDDLILNDKSLAQGETLTLDHVSNFDEALVRLRYDTEHKEAVSGALIDQAGSLYDRIKSDLAKVLQVTPDAKEADKRLSKIVQLHANTTWVPALSLTLLRQRMDERLLGSSSLQTFYALRSFQDNPILAFDFDRLNASERYLSYLGTEVTETKSFKLARQINSGTIPSVDDYPGLKSGRLAKYQAIVTLRSGLSQQATEILLEHFQNESEPVLRSEIGVLLFRSLLRNEDYLTSANIFKEMYLRSDYICELVPLKELLSAIIELSESSEDFDAEVLGQMPVLIAFDAFTHQIGSEFDTERTDAFRDFLLVQGVSLPSELAKFPDRWSSADLIYFYQFVCVPEMLDQLLALRSSREVEDERARILVLIEGLLTASGQPSRPELVEELRQIKTRQLVRDTTLQLDQSKIFVNVEGIKKATMAQLRETWQRYKIILRQADADINFSELQRILSETLGERVAVLSLALPHTEKNKLFAKMFFELRDMFATSKEFGLDSYLSTNIRHGFLLRELRGPFVSQRLITNKSTDSSGYSENKFWTDRIFAENAERIALNDALAAFSNKVDAVIDRMVNSILRINNTQTSEGIFDFSVDKLSLQIFQQRCDNLESAEEFLNATLDFLWDITGQCLSRVRETLLAETLQAFQLALTELQETLQVELRSFNSRSVLSELQSATNLVRPEIRSAIERVASWFTLSGTNEYQNYPLRLAYEAGLATVQSYHSRLRFSGEFSSLDQVIMRGETLPYFARLFSILLENCAVHAGVTEGDLQINSIAKDEGTLLQLTVKNDLSNEKDLDVVRSVAKRISDDYGRDLASELIRREGGSGYPKIWKILTHDLGCKHILNVSVTDNEKFMFDLLMEKRGLVA